MMPGIKGTPILSELGQIQHKCSDICDKLSEELKSNTKGLGLLLHITADPSFGQQLVFVNFAETASKYNGVFICHPGDCFSITDLILLYFSLLQPSFEIHTW